MTTLPTLLIKTLHNKAFIQKAKKLDNTGIVIQQNEYSFLKIKDEYIHELYKLLDNTKAQKPDYFSKPEMIGAHITIAYPEENITLHTDDIGKSHSFSIKNFSHVTLGNKQYLVLIISSPSLIELRAKYNLPSKPSYKGVAIDFHITIATYS